LAFSVSLFASPFRIFLLSFLPLLCSFFNRIPYFAFRFDVNSRFVSSVLISELTWEIQIGFAKLAVAKRQWSKTVEVEVAITIRNVARW
jgi:hypothetical protein